MVRMVKLALVLLAIASSMRAQTVLCPTGASQINMTRGSYSSRPNVIFQLKNFHATLVPMGKTAPLCYDKLTVVSSAEIFVSNQALSTIFSDKLQHSNSKIRDFKVENGLSHATLSGTMNHIVPIHFSVEGPVTTDGTVIRLDAQSIKADGIPVKMLLSMLGEHLNSVLKLNGVGGVVVDQNSLSFSPEKVAHLRGHLSEVVTSDKGLLLRYGTVKVGHPPSAPQAAAAKAQVQQP